MRDLCSTVGLTCDGRQPATRPDAIANSAPVAPVVMRRPEAVTGHENNMNGGPSLFRCDRRQTPAPAERRHRSGKAGLIAFDKQSADCHLAKGNRQPWAVGTGESGRRRLFVHADDTVIVAAHTAVGLERGTAGQDLMIGRRHMRMRSDNKRRP